MAKKATVLVRNHTKRIYNGIKYMQIVSIAEENLDSYLLAGFLEFDGETGMSIDRNAEIEVLDEETDEDDDAPTAIEARNYLISIGVKFAPNTGDPKLIQKALDNGWSAQPVSKDINADGLDALQDAEDAEDTQDQVDGDVADDLGDLADETDEDDAEDAEDSEETTEDAEDEKDAEDTEDTQA